MVADIDKRRVVAGRILSGAIIISTVGSGLVVLKEVKQYPRTDDAEDSGLTQSGSRRR